VTANRINKRTTQATKATWAYKFFGIVLSTILVMMMAPTAGSATMVSEPQKIQAVTANQNSEETLMLPADSMQQAQPALAGEHHVDGHLDSEQLTDAPQGEVSEAAESELHTQQPTSAQEAQVCAEQQALKDSAEFLPAEVGIGQIAALAPRAYQSYTIDLSDPGINFNAIDGLSGTMRQGDTGNWVQVLVFDNAADSNSYTFIQSSNYSLYNAIVFRDTNNPTYMRTNVTLDGITMTCQSNNFPNIELASGVTVNLTLKGANTLKQTATGTGNNASVHLEQTSVLAIGGTGSLAAQSSTGPGISIAANSGTGPSPGILNISGYSNCTVKAQGGGSSAGIGSAAGANVGVINILSTATVEATGGPNGGAGIGAGAGGSANEMSIDSAATIRAYSLDNSRPAIYTTAQNNTGDGYYVNAWLETPLSGATKLKAHKEGNGAVLNELLVPAGYACFAYSTGATSRDDFLTAYDAATGALIGVVTRADTDGPLSSVQDGSSLRAKLMINSAGTPSVTDIMGTTATLWNKDQTIGVGEYMSGGFKYATAKNDTSLDGTIEDVPWGSFSTTPISAPLSNLTVGTTYYVQTYLHTTAGDFTSDIVSFKALLPAEIDLSTTTENAGGAGWRATGTTQPNVNGVSNPDRVLYIGANINGESASDYTYLIRQSYGPGTSLFKQIVVESGVSTTIIISGIDVKGSGINEPTFALQGNADIRLVLQGTNRLAQTASAAGNNAALNVSAGSSVSISAGSGSGTLAVSSGTGSAGIGGGSGQAAGTITINSGEVSARGGAGANGTGGAGIGGGSNGAAAKLSIAPAATVRAWSQAKERPAIHATGTDNFNGGHYVNAYFATAPSANEAIQLNIFAPQATSVTQILELPAGYACFAYTTGTNTPQNDTIVAYDSSGAALLGTVVQAADDSPLIPSVANDSSLRVKLNRVTTLTIATAVSGDYADKTRVFGFTLTIWNSADKPLDGATFPYTGVAQPDSGATPPQDDILTLDDKGEATFTLIHGQGITINELPSTAQVRIIEDMASGYTTSFVDSADASVTETSADTNVRALTEDARAFDFLNTRDAIIPSGVDTGDVDAPLALLTIAMLIVTVALIVRLTFRIRRKAL
jgi:hypothetical protein